MEIVPLKIKHELVKRTCAACNGKGELLARFDCGGEDDVLDRKAISERGAPVFKPASAAAEMDFMRCRLLQPIKRY